MLLRIQSVPAQQRLQSRYTVPLPMLLLATYHQFHDQPAGAASNTKVIAYRQRKLMIMFRFDSSPNQAQIDPLNCCCSERYPRVQWMDQKSSWWRRRMVTRVWVSYMRDKLGLIVLIIIITIALIIKNLSTSPEWWQAGQQSKLRMEGNQLNELISLRTDIGGLFSLFGIRALRRGRDGWLINSTTNAPKLW